MEDKSIFLQVMGDYPVNRVLDFLVVHDMFDYSLTDIAKHSRVGYATLQTFWPALENAEIVIMTRKSGKSNMYKLNKENPIVKDFVKLYWDITDEVTEKEMSKKAVVATA